MYRRNRVTAGLAAVAVAFALGACDDSSPSSPSAAEPQFQPGHRTAAQNQSRQVGLVNVSTGDVELLNNVNLAVAANVLATVCDVTIPVALLATQIVAEGGVTRCETVVEDGITIEQGLTGAGTDPIGGNSSRQVGLVNVSLGDVEILNNVNAAIAANVLVTACDLTVPVAVASLQAVADVGETQCTSDAGQIFIEQRQG